MAEQEGCDRNGEWIHPSSPEGEAERYRLAHEDILTAAAACADGGWVCLFL